MDAMRCDAEEASSVTYFLALLIVSNLSGGANGPTNRSKTDIHVKTS